MKTMIISEFKAKCIATVKQVSKKKESVVLTIRGEPMAVVQPMPFGQKKRVLGGQCWAMKVTGDIVRGDSAGDWEMLVHPERVLAPQRPAQ